VLLTMKSNFKAVWVLLLGISMLWQGSFSVLNADRVGEVATVRKCCRTESVKTADRCAVMSCCQKPAEPSSPISLPLSVQPDLAMPVHHSILDCAPLAARPPPSGRSTPAALSSDVPLHQRFCIFLI